jgi:hypothetical protein
MFEYPIACTAHRDVEGHILFHIFDAFINVSITVDMTAFTTAPIRGRQLDTLLAFMAIPKNQYDIVSAELREKVHETCLAMILDIFRELRSSQYRMLAFLSDIPTRLLGGNDGLFKPISAEQLACMSVCIMNVLDLPSDARVAPLIPGVVSRTRRLIEEMYIYKIRDERENQSTDKEATIAINRLMTHLASMRIFGRPNSQLLTCARSRDTHSPAAGWLPMHTE